MSVILTNVNYLMSVILTNVNYPNECHLSKQYCDFILTDTLCIIRDDFRQLDSPTPYKLDIE